MEAISLEQRLDALERKVEAIASVGVALEDDVIRRISSQAARQAAEAAIARATATSGQLRSGPAVNDPT